MSNNLLDKTCVRFEPPKLDCKLLGTNLGLCSVIAVSTLLDIPFDDAYEKLMFTGYNERMLMNDTRVITKSLEMNFYKLVKWHEITVNDFIVQYYQQYKEYAVKKGIS